MEDEPHPGLRRVEEALQLIRDRDPLHYSRVIRQLERIWVRLLNGDLAHYEVSLGACVLDKRYVLLETTTPERLASTIIHEATHARLEHWGISYDENKRARDRSDLYAARTELRHQAAGCRGVARGSRTQSCLVCRQP